MRLFVAADLPKEVRARLAEMQRALADLPLPVRWVAPGGVHLTLKFLGEAAPGRRAAIEAALAAPAATLAPFRLAASGVGTFPERGAPRVIWVGLEGDVAAARRLQEAVEAAVAPLGFARDDHPFTPHLTLGRVKGPGRGDPRPVLARLGPEGASEFLVHDYVLFESRLGSGGASYTPLARYPLRGAEAR